MAMKQNTSSKEIRAKLRWGIVAIFVLLFVSLVYDVPVLFNQGIDWVNHAMYLGLPKVSAPAFQLGLDLQGGASLVYKANVSNISANQQAGAVQGVRDVIERRVNGMGLGEPSVETSKVGNEYRVNVDLPGIKNVNNAIKMIGQTPTMEFKEEKSSSTTQQPTLTKGQRQQMTQYNFSVEQRASSTLARVQNGKDFGTLAKQFSDDTNSKNSGGYLGYVGPSAVEPAVYSWAAQAKIGDITNKLIKTNNAIYILKRGSKKIGASEITASHILICYIGAQNCSATTTQAKALVLANKIKQEATPKNFAKLAKQYSTDKVSAANGGSLGTFGKGQMVPAFEDAVFAATTGTIIGPVQTQYGYHIIYKQAQKPTQEYELWDIAMRRETPQDLTPQSQWALTGLSGKQLKSAAVVTDNTTGEVQVSLQFDSEGTKLFKDITTRNVGKPVAIFLDGQPISEPIVQQPILDGQAVISGNFNLASARTLAQRLNEGALPVPVELISQETVGATLGAVSLSQSLYAGLIGTLIVMLFMILFYRLPGFIAVIALILYGSVSLAIFKLIGVTLTLAGIAGLILSIGMAVDANVLIFERLKEELRDRKSLKAAVEDGFARAWTSIRDGNITTLITCLLLIWFGSSFVQGFAVTLAIGVLVSMFTAITITRVLLRFIVPWFSTKGNRFFLGYTPDQD